MEDTATSIIPPPDLDGVVAESEVVLADFFDDELADAGIQGGHSEYWINARKGGIKITFWIPNNFPSETLAILTNYVKGQMSDGLGEGGFYAQLGETKVWMQVIDAEKIRHELHDDGKVVPPPNGIAICARDGKIADLRQAIEMSPDRINEKLQGHTALQLAILMGQTEAVRILVRANADVNATGPAGISTMQSAVLSNNLTDQQSCELVRILVAAGANPHEVDTTNHCTLIDLATNRQKHELTALLNTY
ncbi:ankyrin repeat domain-containing protein [Bremerella cremea]|uniref:ankyrin repeat domain-containing protein n=1 Tax=Bremerella cremea TaxID=1031537 RepID=UPI0011C0501E|nr:ankyrin repeat domain-containing protein [Bremerella cremea]